MGGFIPAENLVQNGTAGDNGTAGGTLNQPVLGFLQGMKPPVGGISSGNVVLYMLVSAHVGRNQAA